MKETQIQVTPDYGTCLTNVTEVYNFFDSQISKRNCSPFDLYCYVPEYVAAKFLIEHRNFRPNAPYDYRLNMQPTCVPGAYVFSLNEYEGIKNV